MTPRARIVLAVMLTAGAVSRLLLAAMGLNYDIGSYSIVAEIMRNGGSVYLETERYNYGPIWFHLIHWMDVLPPAAGNFGVFRMKVAGLLALVDAVITILLYRRHGLPVAMLFLLSPIGILISGFHSQFDNLAILIALLGVLLLERPEQQRWLAGLVLLGLSLIVKHIFFALPLWLAMREDRWGRRVMVLAVPVAIFALSFLPYVPAEWPGIRDHVLLYRSFNNAPLWRAILPDTWLTVLKPLYLFLGSLAICGYVWRRLPIWDLTLRYLVAVVLFTSAMTNQYFAIPLVAAAVHVNPMYLLYSGIAATYVLGSRDGLRFEVFRPADEGAGGVWILHYSAIVLLLGAALLWEVVSARRTRVSEPLQEGAVRSRMVS